MVDDIVTLRLTQEQALVLFDWLSRFNHVDGVAFEHQAEQRVLWDLQANLEKVLVAPLMATYDAQLEAARTAVAGATDDGPSS